MIGAPLGRSAGLARTGLAIPQRTAIHMSGHRSLAARSVPGSAMPFNRHPQAALRPFSSTSRLSDATQQIPDRTDVFEAHPERGLRMLMFGKPGSGKVILLLQFGGVSVTGKMTDRGKAHTLHLSVRIHKADDLGDFERPVRPCSLLSPSVQRELTMIGCSSTMISLSFLQETCSEMKLPTRRTLGGEQRISSKAEVCATYLSESILAGTIV